MTMFKKIYVVYPRKFNSDKEIMDYLEKDGDVESFSSLKKAREFKKEYGGWINQEVADEEVFKEIDKYTKRI